MRSPTRSAKKCEAPCLMGIRNWIQFLARAGEGRCSFTTSPTLAEDDPRLTLLTFYHPLIRTVHRHYLENLRELHPACYVRLHSADLPGGRYGWLLYSSEIGGVQPRRDLEIVALHLQHEDALDEDTSETLLWLMAAQAETVPEARRHQEIDGEFIERAEDLFASRLNARFSARRRSNEALVANRLASLRETYERNRELREQRVREARERRRQPPTSRAWRHVPALWTPVPRQGQRDRGDPGDVTKL